MSGSASLSRFVALATVACIAVASLKGHFTTGKAVESEPLEETTSIPLAEIFSTSQQPEIIPVRRGARESFDRVLESMYERGYGLGASNVLLVRADTINDAIQATSRVFLGGRSANDIAGPERRDHSEPNSYWLVAYLGVHFSTPPAWRVESMTRKGSTFKLRYGKWSGYGSKDIHQYFVWVPLGQLVHGPYQLELIEEGHSRLIRTVDIPATKAPTAGVQNGKENQLGNR